jgi:hypothetical protein
MCSHKTRVGTRKKLIEKSVIRLTHLCDVFSRAAEINECYIYKVRTVADSYGLFFERILRSHRNDLSQFQILCEYTKNKHALVTWENTRHTQIVDSLKRYRR